MLSESTGKMNDGEQGTVTGESKWDEFLSHFTNGYEGLENLVYKILYSLNPSDRLNPFLDDIAQEAIYHLYLSVENENGAFIHDPTAWAATVIRNNITNQMQYTMNKVHKDQELNTEDGNETEDTGKCPLDDVEDKDLVKDIVSKAHASDLPVLEKIMNGETLTRQERRRFAKFRSRFHEGESVRSRANEGNVTHV